MKYSSFSLLFLLVSCQSPLPVPVIEPDNVCLKVPADGGVEARECKNFADDLKTFSDVVHAFRAYATKWEKVSDQKKIQAEAADEVTFYGLLISAIGLATKSPDTVISGASVGAAGAIYSKRYTLEIQSHNYDLASQAMQCLYMATIPFSGRPFPDNNSIRNSALESLVDVRRKLRRLQNTLVLGTPDLSAWQVVMKYPLKMPKPVNTSAAGLTGIPVTAEEADVLLNTMKYCEVKIN
jgi:hypothetical protein